MKKIIFITALLVTSIVSFGQYTMSTTIEPYEDLTSPTSVNGGLI